MAKARLSAIAAVSAATGAGIALFCTQKPEEEKKPGLEIISPPPPPPAPAPIIATKGLPVQPPTTTHGVQTLALNPVNPKGILKYGDPGPISDELSYLSFFGSYDRRTRNPSWVAEHITAESVAQATAERKNLFSVDKTIPEPFQAKLTDYARSGYDRGHQVPAESARWSQEAINDTFKLTNMCPQVGVGFNQHYWKYFETFCRRLTQRYPSVRVVTGPLYLPHEDADGKWRVSYEVIGTPPNVAVPTHFYKIIFAEDEDGVDTDDSKVAIGAFVLPNAHIDSSTDLGGFEQDVEVVERASGLQFVQNLDRKRRRRLCEEIKCDHKVKDFKKAVEVAKL